MKMLKLLTKKSLTVILALAVTACVFASCDSSNRTGSTAREPSGSAGDSKQEYGPSDEMTYATTEETTTETTVETTVETTETSVAATQIDEGYYFIKDDWSVNEYEDYGYKYTQMMNTGWHGRHSEIDYIVFKVYENEEDAKGAYQAYYDKSKGYDKGRWEEGENWFISDEWGVMDAHITWMVYREGNILIITDIRLNNKWIVYKDGAIVYEETGESTFKAFVLDNAPAIADFARTYFPEAF